MGLCEASDFSIFTFIDASDLKFCSNILLSSLCKVMSSREFLIFPIQENRLCTCKVVSFFLRHIYKGHQQRSVELQSLQVVSSSLSATGRKDTKCRTTLPSSHNMWDLFQVQQLCNISFINLEFSLHNWPTIT